MRVSGSHRSHVAEWLYSPSFISRLSPLLLFALYPGSVFGSSSPASCHFEFPFHPQFTFCLPVLVPPPRLPLHLSVSGPVLFYVAVIPPYKAMDATVTDGAAWESAPLSKTATTILQSNPTVFVEHFKNSQSWPKCWTEKIVGCIRL